MSVLAGGDCCASGGEHVGEGTLKLDRGLVVGAIGEAHHGLVDQHASGLEHLGGCPISDSTFQVLNALAVEQGEIGRQDGA